MTNDCHDAFAQALEQRWPGLWSSRDSILYRRRFLLLIGRVEFDYVTITWANVARTVFVAFTRSAGPLYDNRTLSGVAGWLMTHGSVPVRPSSSTKLATIGRHLEARVREWERFVSLLRRLPRAERRVWGLE